MTSTWKDVPASFWICLALVLMGIVGLIVYVQTQSYSLKQGFCYGRDGQQLYSYCDVAHPKFLNCAANFTEWVDCSEFK